MLEEREEDESERRLFFLGSVLFRDEIKVIRVSEGSVPATNNT